MRGDLEDFRDRLRRAHASLLELANESASEDDARRLRFKAQGLTLAISYVDDLIPRDPVNPASPPTGRDPLTGAWTDDHEDP